EAQPRVKVGRADGPQMVGVEDVVRNVFAGVSLGCNAFARLCPGPLLRYNGRFKDLPNPAFVQVHDPTVVVFASLASRLMNPHRPQSDAQAVIADAGGHQQSSEQERKVFAVASALGQGLIWIEPGVGRVASLVVGFEVAQCAEEMENRVGAEVETAWCVGGNERLPRRGQILNEAGELVAHHGIIGSREELPNIDGKSFLSARNEPAGRDYWFVDDFITGPIPVMPAKDQRALQTHGRAD